MTSNRPMRAREIDPSKLSTDDADFLHQFLLDNPGETYLPSETLTFPPQHIVYQFKGQRFILKQSLLRRERYIKGISQPQIKYDVLDPMPLGRGAFSLVYNSIKTLRLGTKALEIQDDGNHIVKFICDEEMEAIHLYASDVDSVNSEREKLAIGTRFRPKRLQLQKDGDTTTVLLTTRKFPGQSLDRLLNYDFTSEERLRLTLALLRALKEQVHDLGMIHRDIKPGNIIVDIHTMEVNIIDFGLSIRNDYRDDSRVGTPAYMSPEMIERPDNINEKTDIFSMGRLLAQLWGDSHSIWSMSDYEDIFDITLAGDYDSKLLFNNMNKKRQGHPPKKMKEIESSIKNMVSLDQKKRNQLDQLIFEFHDAYLAEHYLPDDKKNLSDSFQQGSQLRPHLIQSKNRNEFMEKLSGELIDITGHTHCLREFTHGLGLRSLQHATTKKDIYTAADEIVVNYYTAINQYIGLVNQANATLKKYDLIFSSELLSELRLFSLELRQKLDRIKQRPFDLDLLKQSTQSLTTKFSARKNRLDNILRDVSDDLNKNPKNEYKAFIPLFEKPIINAGLAEIDALKNALRRAIRDYVDTTYTKQNIARKDRAASVRRQNDIIALNTILDNPEIKDINTLLGATKDRISKIEDGLFGTGLFGHSKLKRNLKKVIKQHQEHSLSAAKKNKLNPG